MRKAGVGVGADLHIVSAPAWPHIHPGPGHLCPTWTSSGRSLGPTCPAYLKWHYLSMRTSAGIPPDLKMANSPSRWWERLCRMLVVQRAVSRSLVFCMVRTTAATSCGEPMSARLDASFLDSWFTIMAALVTTTWGQERRRAGVSGMPGSDPLLPTPEWVTGPPRTNRVLVVEEFGELGQGSRGQLGIVLVVDQVHDGRLEQLGRLGQSLQVGALPLHLRGQQQRAVLAVHAGAHRLSHPLGSGGGGHLVLQVTWGPRDRWLSCGWQGPNSSLRQHSPQGYMSNRDPRSH